MKVQLIRHAESAANAGLPTTSPGAIPLTDLGNLQAEKLAASITQAPDLIISSPFERALHTARPTALRFPEVPKEVWQIEEFTYLSPGRFAGTTQADRRPAADDYWRKADAMAVDGPGAESFAQLLMRAQSMLDRLSGLDLKHVAVFSHGQFIRAVAWLIKHGDTAGQPEQMREFRRLDAQVQMRNCDSYQLVLTEGRWNVYYNLTMEGMRFIDQFCDDQPFAPLPDYPHTAEIRDAMEHLKYLFD